MIFKDRQNHRYLLLLTAACIGQMVAAAQMPLLAPLPGTGKLIKAENLTQFSFVAAGDNRPAHAKCLQPAIAKEIFSAVPTLNPRPAFVLWGGDTIYGKQPEKPKRIHRQYKEFLTIAATASTPIFNAPGNHEMDDRNNVPSKEMRALYEKNMGSTFGAFTYGNSRFIALNSENEPPSESPATSPANPKKKGKSELPGYVTKKQLVLLQQDLDGHRDAAHIFIFLHHPVKPANSADGLAPDNAAALERMFRRYSNISYVISGHEHMYYNAAGGRNEVIPPPKRSDPFQPPYYLVSGGAGAPLKSLPGGFYHYLVFKVDGANIDVNLVRVDSHQTEERCDAQ
jgi:hypothetical protein